MASKTRKKSIRRKRADEFTPKAGPGQVFARIGDDDGNLGKRLRNMGASPLMLAFHRGQLDTPPGNRITAKDRFDCGEIFEKRWKMLHKTPWRDSLDPGIRGGSGDLFSDAQQDAGRMLQRWARRMDKTNFRIVSAFCGDQHGMAAALRVSGIEAHPVGTAFRIREALDDLVRALTGMDAHERPVDRIRADRWEA